jgi:hypothetical protein
MKNLGVEAPQLEQLPTMGEELLHKEQYDIAQGKIEGTSK